MVKVVIGLSAELLSLGVSTVCNQTSNLACRGEASSQAELLALCDQAQAEVAVTDPAFLKPSGVETVSLLKSGGTRTVLLGDNAVIDELASLIKAGASGHLPVTCSPDALADGLRRAASGDLILGASLTRDLLGVSAPPRTEPPLSTREREILELVARGLCNREIAQAMFISESTVKTHLTRASDKLGTRGRSASVAEALRRNLLLQGAPVAA